MDDSGGFRVRVLDLDLDFFLDGRATLRDDTERLSDAEYVPWTKQAVRRFLEKQCGLSRKFPIKGRIVEHHHEAFLFWRDLTLSRQLDIPFDLVHVDAHADLGLGEAGWVYLQGQILQWEIPKRAFPEIGPSKLTAGSYLAFALACRWISDLTYVTHPNWRDDLMHDFFKDFDPASGYLQLKGYRQDDLDGINRLETLVPISVEPEVPFRTVACSDYLNTEPFSLMVVSHSPGFTPPSADALLPVFAEYILAI